MEVKKLKKYIGSGGGWVWLVFGGFMEVFGLGFLVSLLRDGTELSVAWVVLVILGGGGVLIWLGWSTIQDRKKMFREMEETGEIQRVLSDFETALPLVNGNVRLGQHYIFGKGKARIIRYGEIRQVYQHITRRNFIESERCMKYVDSKGKTRDMCNLLLRGKSDEDVMRIMLVIQAKNPTVKLGYK